MYRMGLEPVLHAPFRFPVQLLTTRLNGFCQMMITKTNNVYKFCLWFVEIPKCLKRAYNGNSQLSDELIGHYIDIVKYLVILCFLRKKSYSASSISLKRDYNIITKT